MCMLHVLSKLTLKGPKLKKLIIAEIANSNDPDDVCPL